jgi:hypothetical protein
MMIACAAGTGRRTQTMLYKSPSLSLLRWGIEKKDFNTEKAWGAINYAGKVC